MQICNGAGLEIVNDMVDGVVSNEEPGVHGRGAPATPTKSSGAGGSTGSGLISSVKKKIIGNDKSKGLRDKFKSIKYDVADLSDEDILEAIVEIHKLVAARTPAEQNHDYLPFVNVFTPRHTEITRSCPQPRRSL